MRIKRILLLIIVLAILSQISYFGFTKYKENQEMELRNKNATPLNEALEHLRELRERNK